MPSIVSEIEKQSKNNNINLVDYFNVTKNGLNSCRMKELSEKNQPKQSNLKNVRSTESKNEEK